MALTDITAEAVTDALDEFDQIGRDAFLKRYDVGEAHGYYVQRNDKKYDAKAVLAAAHGKLQGRQPLHANEFQGGQPATRALQKLGFQVLTPTQAASASGDLPDPRYTAPSGAHRYDKSKAEEWVKAGKVPPPPDFSAPTHDHYRHFLEEVVELARRQDLEGLRRWQKIDPKSSSRIAILDYRDLCIRALEHATQSALPAQKRFWVEKTIVKGRPDRASGDHKIGTALWSPQRSKDNRDIYANMRAVSPGDIVLHLTDNFGFTGISIAAQKVNEKFEGVADTAWGKQPSYRVQLKDYQQIAPPLTRDALFSDAEISSALLESLIATEGEPTFYNKTLELNQGAYLTEASPQLISVLTNAYKKSTGKSLPYLHNSDNDVSEPKQMPTAVTKPVNLILYGPPGTGKTYATIGEAVRLCDGHLPESGAEAVKERYDALVKAKRIEFVTFHQSYSYEDFVMGLRPEIAEPTGTEGSASTVGGFSLVPTPGVFYRMAKAARANRGPLQNAVVPKLNKDRNVFKMSLGATWLDEGTSLFRECIDGGYVLLGWGGNIDWSSREYGDIQAIRDRWIKEHPEAKPNDSNIRQLHRLRNLLKDGDLVIISLGNKRFRAIGEVTGPYQYVAAEDHEYFHRRPVRWLWHNDTGLPREQIYNKEFIQVSIYQFDSADIEWEALEQIVTGGGELGVRIGNPEAYVLIIDEINRADVSKVFGELITLLEPDKRLGMQNALTVTLPYSNEQFDVPANLHVIGTMNTADRSIALLDSALRRRFQFKEIMPNTSLLKAVDGIDIGAALEGLNARIEYLFDRDHQIGHAYFMECATRAELEAVMRDKVIPLLAEYFYEDWSKVWRALAEPEAEDGAFLKRNKLVAPKGGEEFDEDISRWRFTVREIFAENAFLQLAK